MAHNLRKELDSLMKAQLEQTEVWHTTMERPGDWNVVEAVNFLVAWSGVLREAILRVAEEVDRLSGTDEPQP